DPCLARGDGRPRLTHAPATTIACRPGPPVPFGASTTRAQWMVMPMKVGVARETAHGERRVALVPEALGKLTAAGLEILVEAGAGAGATIPDQAFADAGAQVVDTAALYAGSDVVLRVQRPSPEEAARLRTGQAVIGLLGPLLDPQA